MTSPAPLTDPEQAVVDVLAGESACSWHVGCDVEDCYGPRAKAIVAAVEPIHTIAALEAAATALDELAAANARAGRGTPEGPWIAAGVQGAALNVRRQIRELRQSLSLPASKETPNA